MQNIWRIRNTVASILRENMLVYLFLDKISSSKLTTFSFLEFSKRECGYRWKISVPHNKLHLKQKKGENLQFIISQSIFPFKRFGVRFNGAINVRLRFFSRFNWTRQSRSPWKHFLPPLSPPPPIKEKKNNYRFRRNRERLFSGALVFLFFFFKSCLIICSTINPHKPSLPFFSYQPQTKSHCRRKETLQTAHEGEKEILRPRCILDTQFSELYS